MRALLAIVLLLAATGAGIATASAFVDGGDESLEREPEHLLPGPAEPIAGARAAAPSGGPPWAVRTYVSRTGRLCAERGRLARGLFGDVDDGGRFEPRPAGPTGVCADPGRDPVVAAVDQVAAHGATPAHTIVFGASLRRPARAVLRPEAGPELELPIGPRGSFIAVLPGLREPATLPLAVELHGGDVETFTWTAPPP